MILSIMQPYFFPYVGYFSLIKHCDQFILFDTPQFTRHRWIDRNRILKPNGEPLYVKVPIMKYPRGTAINEIQIKRTENWKSKILAQLVPYKKKAQHYYKVKDLIERSLDKTEGSLSVLNQKTLVSTCDYLSIKTPIHVWSDMGVEIDPVRASDEWALNICKALGADSYINPVGGLSFFDKQKYMDNGISISFLESDPVPYSQFGNEFRPFLSIIDVLMFNDVGRIHEMIDSFNKI